MVRVDKALLIFFLVIGFGSQAKSFAAECELTNDALESMPLVSVTLSRADESYFSIKAKLADNIQTRAAGFQRVCEEIIAKTPILFLFERPVTPSFHMNNVVAPIDIAFIKASGKIDVIRKMKPYSVMLRSKPTYSPKAPVVAALEVREGFYSDHNIKALDRIEWSISSSLSLPSSN